VEVCHFLDWEAAAVQMKRCVFPASLLAAAWADPAGVPSWRDDPAMVPHYADMSTRASAADIASCTEYPSGAFVPLTTIAQDWVKGGGRQEDCAAALIVASGETSCTAAGCESVASGIWQVTSPDMPAPSGCADGSTNPCCTVDFVRNHFDTRNMSATTTTSWQVGCLGEFSKGNGWAGDVRNAAKTLPPSSPMDISSVVGDIVPADHSGGGLGGTQSNWIGPFCHQGAISCEWNDPYCTSKPQTGTTGDNWGGGSVWMGQGTGDQIYPFPYYYYARFVEANGDGTGMTGEMHCHTMPVSGKVGTCGGLPSKNIPDCDQPVNGQAPKDQACLDSITTLAIKLAQDHCAAAYLEESVTELQV
jgi:hypothetical protein